MSHCCRFGCLSHGTWAGHICVNADMCWANVHKDIPSSAFLRQEQKPLRGGKSKSKNKVPSLIWCTMLDCARAKSFSEVLKLHGAFRHNFSVLFAWFLYIHKYLLSTSQLAALGQVVGGFGQTLTWGGGKKYRLGGFIPGSLAGDNNSCVPHIFQKAASLRLFYHGGK